MMVVLNNDLRNLEQFLGNTSITYTSSNSEDVNHFLGNNFLEIFVEQSSLYPA
jgi:hypothetical protein